MIEERIHVCIIVNVCLCSGSLEAAGLRMMHAVIGMEGGNVV